MKRITLYTGIAMYLLSTPAHSQKKYLSLINKYVNAQVKVNDFSGTILVISHDTIVYKKAIGYADREWNSLNTVNTKFEIGSITKQFTAAAVLQLAEAGKLHLDDRLSVYFPGYPKGDSITLHMLLNHTSGIADFTSLPEFYHLHTLSLAQDSVIALFKNVPLAFTPGTKWAYSNSGYFLLGCIIEKVTHLSYRNYLYENLIKKAGLKNTDVNRLDSILPFRARGYSKNRDQKWKNADYFSMEIPFSAGSMISTSEDLYQWEWALQSGKVISDSMFSKMTTPYMPSYGYGLRIDTFMHFARYSHTGTIPGFSAYLGSVPSKGIFVIILTNSDFNTDSFAEAIYSVLFNLPLQMPYKPVERHISSSILIRYVGQYEVGNTKFELEIRGGNIMLKPAGGGEIELKPESDSKFFFAMDPSQQFEFSVDKQGKIRECFFINKGSKIKFKKID